MPAFSPRHAQLIRNGINAMARKMIGTITPAPKMTYSEVMDMLSITGELRSFLMDGRRLVNLSDSEACGVNLHNICGCSVLVFVSGGKNAPLMPAEFHLDTAWLTSNEKGKQIVRRCEQVMELSEQWGNVYHVFDQLQDRMAAPAQVRYVWPSIMAIMDFAANQCDDESLMKLRNKLLPLKVPRELPLVPHELRALIRQTSATIATSTFLPNALDATVRGVVELTITAPHRRISALGETERYAMNLMAE